MMSGPNKTRASHAHGQTDLRRDNPFYERAGCASTAFNAECTATNADPPETREGFMVKRQQPKPVHRPSPSLALGPDGAAFDAEWRAEYADARQSHDNRNQERNHAMSDEHSNHATEPKQPREVMRDGNLKASLWENRGEKGAFYSATFARTYRDEQGKYHDAHSFSGTELLRLSELARTTYGRSQELRREDHQTEQTREQAPARDNSQSKANIQEAQRSEGQPQSRDERRSAFIEQRQGQHNMPPRQRDR